MKIKHSHIILLLIPLLTYCYKESAELNLFLLKTKNILNYKGTPKTSADRSFLMFSDQGAWFAYSFPDTISNYGGFSGPFLMTQENGIWSSSMLSQLNILDANKQNIIWETHQISSYNSHLEQTFSNINLILHQQLIFSSGHTAIIKSSITNRTKQAMDISFQWGNKNIFANGLSISSNKNEVIIASSNSNAIGHILFPNNSSIISTIDSYKTKFEKVTIAPNDSKEIQISHTFIFPEYSWTHEKKRIKDIDFKPLINNRKIEKETQLNLLIKKSKKQFSNKKYSVLLAKAQLTLQNNWRIATNELKHEGLFPSYHYEWFNGFWSWDSWKHAAGLSYYNLNLAKNQMRAMFDFQNKDGFIVDVIFRDTLIEKHNYRNTKPPLAAWAVSEIYKKDNDIEFVKEFYPKLTKYHQWWYDKRDHDKDGLCEYGSTDGSVIAAKWESGMDNAIRFDNSKILKNHEGAYSLDQESVDLNAYLYAEKLYLANLAKILNKIEEVKRYLDDAAILKSQIQNQFYDSADGWFYDTNLNGNQFIKGEGSEGWTPLWANAATQEQAEAVKNRMMNPNKFFTKVPFQTMSADHPKFNPLNGYWRGPNWLDQAYFGVKGLRNYNFNKEADLATGQILKGARGLLEKGESIRENYHPITGEGLNAENFSWSAAHIIMLLMED